MKKIFGGLLLLGAALSDGGSSASRVARDAAAIEKAKVSAVAIFGLYVLTVATVFLGTSVILNAPAPLIVLVASTPVIAAQHAYERDGATHPSVAIVDDTIHITYTGKATPSYEDGLTLCHATAPTSDPAAITKDPANPVLPKRRFSMMPIPRFRCLESKLVQP